MSPKVCLAKSKSSPKAGKPASNAKKRKGAPEADGAADHVVPASELAPIPKPVAVRWKRCALAPVGNASAGSAAADAAASAEAPVPSPAPAAAAPAPPAEPPTSPLKNGAAAAVSTAASAAEASPAVPLASSAPLAAATQQEPPPPGPSNSSSSSSSNSAKAPEKMDFSFATGLESKPPKYVRRVMGEAQRILCQKGVEDGRTSGYEFRLADRNDLSRWAVKVSDLNDNSLLVKDLKQFNLDLSIDLEIILPDGFPLDPPFARVVYPELAGGYVFQHGGICFEPLTPKGWAPSMTLPSLVIAIKGILDHGEVRCKGEGNKATRTVKHYTEEGARKDHNYIVKAHRGGEGASYGSLSRYKS